MTDNKRAAFGIAHKGSSSSPNASHLYDVEPDDFYELQARSVNPLRRWFHTNRSLILNRLVRQFGLGSGKMVDFGCGNAIWNQNLWPVTGVDISAKALRHTMSTGRINEAICSGLDTIPIESGSVDLVVCSEVLEHLENYPQTIREAYRILRVGGFFITSVPHDTILSLWKPLFTLQCLYQGYMRGDPYYKKFCGHINHFSPERIRNALAQGGFYIPQQFSMKRITIFTIGQKTL